MTVNRKMISILAAVLVVFAFVPFFAAKAYADEEIKPIEWQLTKDSSGVVTAAKSKWTATSGATKYMMYLYRKGTSGSLASAHPTSANYNFSETILEQGYGSYYVEGYAINSTGLFIAHYKSDTLALSHVTFNTQGNGNNIVLNNVDSSITMGDLIQNGFLSKIGNPSVYYSNDRKKALVGLTMKAQSELQTFDSFSASAIYVIGDGPTYFANWDLATLQSIGRLDATNPVINTVWFNVINNVELNVSTPGCNESTDTPKSGSKWDWDNQTNRPAVTVPSGKGYHLAEGANSWWEKMNNADEPYVGQFVGDNDYRFNTELVADYGYVFPGDNDGIDIHCTVNGGTYMDCYNSDDSYGYWLYNDDAGTYAVPLWVDGKVHVSHVWNDGEMTSPPTSSTDGVMTYTCGVCNATRTETISHEKIIGLVDIGNVWTNLDPFNNVPFTAEINPDGSYGGVPLEDMMGITNESWTGSDGSVISMTSPGKAKVGKSYSYKVEVTAKGDYWFYNDFDFIYGGTGYAWGEFNAVISPDHKTVVISGFVPDKKVLGADLSKATITGVSDKTYTGKALTQSPVIKLQAGGALRTLKAGTDYALSYKNNVNAGTATMTVTGKGNYRGTASRTFKISKAVNPLNVKGKTATVKLSKLKNADQKLKAAKYIKTVKAGQGTIKYTLSSAKKGSKSFKKNFKVDSKTGKLTVKKGLKKGKYKLKIKVKAAGNGNYSASAEKIITVTINVK